MNLILFDNITIKFNINKIKPYNKAKEKPSIFILLFNISQDKEYNVLQIIKEFFNKYRNI